MKYILSYGGGVNSSALFFHILDLDMPLDLVIFSDTGEELPQTYAAVDRLREKCERFNIPFIIVKSDLGSLYDYYYKKKALPSIMRRDCTGKFKVSPIRKYLRERYGKKEKFCMYIGITIDEAHRASDSNVKYITHNFPFIKGNIDREDCHEILRLNNFSAIKSGCTGCPYIAKKGFTKLYHEDNKEFQRWQKLEENCSAYPRVRLINRGSTLKQIARAIKEQTKITDYEELNNCGDCAGACFL